jgi:hypothetical protein
MSNISLIKVESHLDGPFSLWLAQRENSDGTISYGYVQSDGHAIAEETWEDTED